MKSFRSTVLSQCHRRTKTWFSKYIFHTLLHLWSQQRDKNIKRTQIWQAWSTSIDVNTRIALGYLHAGIGQTHINNVLSTVNTPTLNSSTFKQREREVGRVVEDITKTSCQESLKVDKAEAINNGVESDENHLIPIPCSFDMAGRKEVKGTIPELVMLQSWV